MKAYSVARHNFNPRARVGRDAASCSWSPRTIYFNPRARVGRDNHDEIFEQSYIHFNPRARVGRDACGGLYESLLYISIHAPAWGATSRTMRFSSRAPFQSTRPRGARPSSGMSITIPMDFNPRARVGRDKLLVGQCHSPRHFNPRARVGRDYFN